MYSLSSVQGTEIQQSSARELAGKTAVVVGASRGLGHGVVTALGEAGVGVVALSRTQVRPNGEAGHEPAVHWELGDAGDATTPRRILDAYDPHIVVIVAGASPHMAPLQQHTWETFSANWNSDVRIAFHWLREILLRPLRPGGRVIVFSSGAALNGSPLSGGYAGAKATQRFITAYAQDEARRARLDIAFAAVLPRFSPQTGVGRPAVQAYADRTGQSVDDYLAALVATGGPLVTPEGAGAAVVELACAKAADVASAYLLSGDGLKKLS
ncbi:SDR family oxidoreductase [Rhodoblastus sp. 17X3]|uniref:SDR family NAD(P)-dependent oxidoreductase n=1 Tax=Rhodoblastus sp. 17X3 TaxID=3047026 RepID=UPI0024B6D284|nr:SDR family oxidoreductase [Rhodoblastus sp. 17X3]MDI9847834.1 SDR family oxidoreductase [Rhodoblastus sp. 17X3]